MVAIMKLMVMVMVMVMKRKRTEAKFPCYWSCQCPPPTPHTNVQIRAGWWWWWWTLKFFSTGIHYPESRIKNVRYLLPLGLNLFSWETQDSSKLLVLHLESEIQGWYQHVPFRFPFQPRSQLATKACAFVQYSLLETIHNFRFILENPRFSELV